MRLLPSVFESGDEIKLAPVLHKFSEYCSPRKNITILRRKFFTWGHPLSTYAIFSEKLTSLTPCYAHVGVRIRRYVSFSENFAYVLNG